MRATACTVVATLGLMLASTSDALAQSRAFSPNAPRKTIRSSYRKPLTSPYLNLLRDGAPPAINYHALVRPMASQEYVNAREDANVASLRNEVRAEERAFDPRAGSPNVRPTGQPGRFMDYSSYYFRTPQ